MIKRINLIEKKAFSFTYLKLMQICMFVLLLNVTLVVLQVVKVKNLEKESASLQEEIVVLQEKQAELTKKPARKQISVGQYQELFDRLQNTPRWSDVLAEISKSMPNSLWMTQFNSVSQVPGTALQPVSDKKVTKKGAEDKTKQAAVVVPKINTLEVSGMSSEINNITDFSRLLSTMDQIKNLTISNSEKESFGFSFTIKAEVTANVR